MIDLSGLTTELAPGEEFLPPFQMALFDRRVRMPLEWLVESVRTESGQHVTIDDLRRFAADGWFPLVNATDGSEEPGVYLYTPSRVGLYLVLQGQGYTAEELRDLAEREEWQIETIGRIRRGSQLTDRPFSDPRPRIPAAPAVVDAGQSRGRAGRP